MEQLPALSPVLCILLPLSIWAAGLEVHQSPRALQASAGDTATLNCSFQNPQGSTAKATWTRDGVVLNSAHPFYTGRLNMSHLDVLRKGEATMTLWDLEPRDSGLYRCQINIHRGESGTGQGTELSVTGRNQSDPDKGLSPMECGTREVLYQVSIALGLLFILILVVGLLLKRCRALPCSQPRRQEPQGQGSREAAETQDLHYAEIKVKNPRRMEQISNHAQRC
ncbi:natural cytotoxicity triggering receptor 3-like isoform X2 [Pelodiscus sinensis]|uniref:natural cytotoxicity triggering receptor 3-like isoform X2 n=1 Tax=Pelodiscus sinensis TaxID=13735 RepID=UPI003F6C3FF1